jgi:hypothetical protein
VQIVMFTMHTSEQLREDARAVGIKDVISKSDTIGGHLFASLKDHQRSAESSLFPVEKTAVKGSGDQDTDRGSGGIPRRLPIPPRAIPITGRTPGKCESLHRKKCFGVPRRHV